MGDLPEQRSTCCDATVGYDSSAGTRVCNKCGRYLFEKDVYEPEGEDESGEGPPARSPCCDAPLNTALDVPICGRCGNNVSPLEPVHSGSSEADEYVCEGQAFTSDVRDCGRCDGVHSQILFKPLTNPPEDFTHYAICPDTHEPILAETEAVDG